MSRLRCRTIFFWWFRRTDAKLFTIEGFVVHLLHAPISFLLVAEGKETTALSLVDLLLVFDYTSSFKIVAVICEQFIEV